MPNKLEAEVGNIKDRIDLSKFVLSLRADFVENRETWSNTDMPSFLEAMAAWIQDMDGYYKNQGLDFSEQQSWRVFGEILLASRIYE